MIQTFRTLHLPTEPRVESVARCSCGGGHAGADQVLLRLRNGTASTVDLAALRMDAREPAGAWDDRPAGGKGNPTGLFIRIAPDFPQAKRDQFFKRASAGEYTGLVTLWQTALRLVASHAQKESKIPEFQAGFVLEEDTRGMTLRQNGRMTVCLNPLEWDAYRRQHKQAEVLAQYLFTVAGHEIAHLPDLQGMHGDAFMELREAISFAAAPVLRELTAQVCQTLGLPACASSKIPADPLATHDLLARLDGVERLRQFEGWLGSQPEGAVLQARLRANPNLALRLLKGH